MADRVNRAIDKKSGKQSRETENKQGKGDKDKNRAERQKRRTERDTDRYTRKAVIYDDIQ